jgi:hypothetical protein
MSEEVPSDAASAYMEAVKKTAETAVQCIATFADLMSGNGETLVRGDTSACESVHTSFDPKNPAVVIYEVRVNTNTGRSRVCVSNTSEAGLPVTAQMHAHELPSDMTSR